MKSVKSSRTQFLRQWHQCDACTQGQTTQCEDRTTILETEFPIKQRNLKSHTLNPDLFNEACPSYYVKMMETTYDLPKALTSSRLSGRSSPLSIWTMTYLPEKSFGKFIGIKYHSRKAELICV